MDIHLKGLQFEAFLVRHVVQRDGAEVRQIGFGADCRVFGNFDGDLVTLILIGKRLDLRQRCRDSALGVIFVVTQPCCPSAFLRPFTFHVLTPHALITLVSSIRSGRFFPTQDTAIPTDISSPGTLRRSHLSEHLRKAHAP